MLQHELETAVSLARLAGETILRHYREGFLTEEKLGADNYYEPVTIADREASRIIVNGLIKAFPTDGILSEEELDNLEVRLSSSRVWIIDPIDGTSGFVNHDGDFCVQIGLTINGVPSIGVVYLPFQDVLTHAVKGGGTYVSLQGAEPNRMHTSDRRDFADMRLAVSRNHRSPRMKRIIEQFGFRNTVSRGSVGIKVGLIVDRTCDIYIHPSPRTKLWDTCAPEIILKEAGGRFTDLFGNTLRYDLAELQNRNGILATNGAAHERAVEYLQPLLREFGRTPFIHAA
ncbi:MAG: 3'(2'),5'-bisphosphate nucleotidase CysQ [Pyrinomonadaceae bacterium]